jgi:hypothetical protein
MGEEVAQAERGFDNSPSVGVRRSGQDATPAGTGTKKIRSDEAAFVR